ncbi:hypothetical protein KP509_22G016400 [Ceratopteris richardii]|uniref:Uncharacterized protein n=1 Tax=Ceratopteris richardii TaxID=49495 RepID=A0A8T2S667_CERRI|nr:hypothetical protein KP509_22G016400 [Ceratopteris richardii]
MGAAERKKARQASSKRAPPATTWKEHVPKGYALLVFGDVAMAFLWVFSNAIMRVAIDLGFPYMESSTRQLLKRASAVGLIFLFYGLSKLANGSAYNPLTVIAYFAAGITHYPLYILALRLPAQIIGAMIGTTAAVSCLPIVYKPQMTGPFLRVHRNTGAIAEGMLSFAVVFIVLLTNFRGPRSGIRKTWITSISRVYLSSLGAQYTGPAMNPANAFGWAFLKNQHKTWEHLYVYWIAPILATLAAALLVRAIVTTSKVKLKQN